MRHRRARVSHVSPHPARSINFTAEAWPPQLCLGHHRLAGVAPIWVLSSPLESPSVARSQQPLGAKTGYALEELLSEQLRRDRRRDLLRGYTHSGPHADDVVVFLDARPADTHASQGQIRALVLSLKIAEIQHLFRVLGEAPVLLLDDVSSELDPQRNVHLFEFLRTMPCQVFITTTSPAHVQLGEERKDIHVRSGAICDERD